MRYLIALIVFGVFGAACSGSPPTQRAIREITVSVAGDAVFTYRFAYTDERLASVTTRDEDGDDAGRYQVRYNDEDLVNEVAYVEPDGDEDESIRLTYDDDDLLERLRVRDGSLETVLEYDYDDDELLSRITFEFESGTPERIDYVYEDGVIAEIDDRLEGTTSRFDYDSDGRIDEISTPGDQILTFEYNEDDRLDTVERETDFATELWEARYSDDDLIAEIRRLSDVFETTTYQIEYEEFDVEGFAFLPAVALPTPASDYFDLAGEPLYEPAPVSDAISQWMFDF